MEKRSVKWLMPFLETLLTTSVFRLLQRKAKTKGECFFFCIFQSTFDTQSDEIFVKRLPVNLPLQWPAFPRELLSASHCSSFPVTLTGSHLSFYILRNDYPAYPVICIVKMFESLQRMPTRALTCSARHSIVSVKG